MPALLQTAVSFRTPYSVNEKSSLLFYQSPGFPNINLRTPGSFGTILLVAVTKFQDKFASLRQVNSSNSQDKFQICCTDMCLVEFLANFAVFHVFLSISRDFADIPEFRGSATARNFRSPVWRKEVVVNNYAPINSKVQHPPRATPRAFELLKIGLFKFPPLGARKPFKCPTN